MAKKKTNKTTSGRKTKKNDTPENLSAPTQSTSEEETVATMNTKMITGLTAAEAKKECVKLHLIDEKAKITRDNSLSQTWIVCGYVPILTKWSNKIPCSYA